MPRKLYSPEITSPISAAIQSGRIRSIARPSGVRNAHTAPPTISAAELMCTHRRNTFTMSSSVVTIR